jgi:hypothetical protein
MKKFSIYILLSLLFFACNSQQEEIEDEINKPVENEEKIPTSFTQKILIEYNSNALVGLSMQGDEYAKIEKEKYPNRVIATSIHYPDYTTEMQVKEMTDYFDDTYEFYKCTPMGFVNRMQHDFHINLGLYTSLDPYNWKDLTDSLYRRDQTSSGIALQTTYNQETKAVSVITKVATNSKFNLLGKYKLLVYLTENDVTHFQNNIFSRSEEYKRHAFGDKYYYLPPVINDYTHNDVLRNIFTSREGENLEIQKTGIITQKSYSISLTKENYQNCNVIAVLLKEDKNRIFQVENAQITKLGENQSWD